MIVIDSNNFVQASGILIERVDVNGEFGLIKVWTDLNNEFGFFFIGTDDRNSYQIIEEVSVPNSDNPWYYIDGEFVPHISDYILPAFQN